MEIFMLLITLFSFLLICLIGTIAIKIIKNKSLPNNYYTPFDYITAQVTNEFHEEKEEEKEEDEEQGDNKDKNKKFKNPK